MEITERSVRGTEKYLKPVMTIIAIENEVSISTLGSSGCTGIGFCSEHCTTDGLCTKDNPCSYMPPNVGNLCRLDGICPEDGFCTEDLPDVPCPEDGVCTEDCHPFTFIP